MAHAYRNGSPSELVGAAENDSAADSVTAHLTQIYQWCEEKKKETVIKEQEISREVAVLVGMSEGLDELEQAKQLLEENMGQETQNRRAVVEKFKAYQEKKQTTGEQKDSLSGAARNYELFFEKNRQFKRELGQTTQVLTDKAANMQAEHQLRLTSLKEEASGKGQIPNWHETRVSDVMAQAERIRLLDREKHARVQEVDAVSLAAEGDGDSREAQLSDVVPLVQEADAASLASATDLDSHYAQLSELKAQIERSRRLEREMEAQILADSTTSAAAAVGSRKTKANQSSSDTSKPKKKRTAVDSASNPKRIEDAELITLGDSPEPVPVVKLQPLRGPRRNYASLDDF